MSFIPQVRAEELSQAKENEVVVQFGAEDLDKKVSSSGNVHRKWRGWRGLD